MGPAPRSWRRAPAEMMRRRRSAAATASPDTAVAIARTVPSSVPIRAARFRDPQGREPLRLIARHLARTRVLCRGGSPTAGANGLTACPERIVFHSARLWRRSAFRPTGRSRPTADSGPLGVKLLRCGYGGVDVDKIA